MSIKSVGRVTKHTGKINHFTHPGLNSILEIMPSNWLKQLNFVTECRAARMAFWQCPPFLVLVMGLVTIISMVATYLLATRYTEEPEIAALIVIFVTALFLVVGNLIITGFNAIAQANRMKSEFISIVSHQLRSPLSIFKWTLEAMNRAPHSGAVKNSSEDSFLQNLQGSTEKMIRLVNSLLEVSRIEARTLILKKEKVSLAYLTQSILNDFQNYAQASNVAIALKAEPGIPLVEVDRDRLSMVIHNLVDNAIRYSGGGRVEIIIKHANSQAEFRVKDTGVGIPESQKKFIFQKFFRAQNSTRHQTEGTGIGLYIAKSIIEASGGKIGFDSEEGSGSTFWFTLPVKSR